RLLLFERKTNSIAKNALLKDLQENHYLQKYLSLKEIKEVVDRFPAEDEFHDSSKVHKRIELISEFPKWEDYHKFSSPVLIGKNRFLVYHYKTTGRFNLEYGVILFSIVGNSYEIDQEITLKQVIM